MQSEHDLLRKKKVKGTLAANHKRKPGRNDDSDDEGIESEHAANGMQAKRENDEDSSLILDWEEEVHFAEFRHVAFVCPCYSFPFRT